MRRVLFFGVEGGTAAGTDGDGETFRAATVDMAGEVEDMDEVLHLAPIK